jgi:hypothetical protein
MFQMLKAMFLDISHAVARRNRYFRRRVKAAGILSFTTLIKIVVAVRMLAYGDLADHIDEYICMGESIILEYVTKTMVQEYRDIYLREPNVEDIDALLLQSFFALSLSIGLVILEEMVSSFLPSAVLSVISTLGVDKLVRYEFHLYSWRRMNQQCKNL